jgi:uncharacterized repeat protein (TIGR03803 family)
VDRSGGLGDERRWWGAVIAALSVMVVVSSCSSEGGGSAVIRDPGTTLPGSERCVGVPPDEQRTEALELVHAFDGSDGADPQGSLVSMGDQIYGRTRGGGEHDAGVVFSVEADGSGYDVVRSYAPGADQPDGNHPLHGHLSTVSGLLYGATPLGGQADGGTLSSIDPVTGAERVLHRFAGPPDDGANPHGQFLVTSRGLWILTAAGGAHDRGALVKVHPESGATEVAHSFSGPDGAEPHGRVVRSGEKTIYGMTTRGGGADDGVIFSMDPDTYDYRVIHEFGPGPDNGQRPDHGSLYEGAGADKRLWGVTAHGGAHGQGVLFTVTNDGSRFEVQHSFGATGDDAVRPLGSLTWADGHFYGLSSEGGRFGLGSVFRIADDGTDYGVVASFGGSETGAFPRDDVLVYRQEDAPSVLYGTAANGGPNDPDCQQALGVVFRLDLADLADLGG